MKSRILFPFAFVMLVALMISCKETEEPGLTPELTSTEQVNIYPIENATNVAINSRISATFQTIVDPSTKFSLQSGGLSVTGATEVNGTAISFLPTASLSPNTSYKVQVTTATDPSGKSLAYAWSFTTGATADKIIPTVALTAPLNDTKDVALTNRLIVTTFSEPMDLTSLTFTLKRGSTVVPGAITYTRTAASFTSSADLDPNERYTGAITTGAKDMSGNALTSNYSFSFVTADAADISSPTVKSTNPGINGPCVPLNTVVSVNFSEAMNPTTINSSTFTLTQNGVAVTGTVNYCATCSGTTATFTPSASLTPGTTYCATITTGAKDLAGNAFETSYTWCFITCGTAPTAYDLGPAGNFAILAKTAITNVPISSVIGDVGLSPNATSGITGFALTASAAYDYATSTQVTGKIYGADMTEPTPSNLTIAILAMEAAYTDLSNRPLPNFTEHGGGNIGGMILLPGLYKWTTNVSAPTNVTLSGSANDTWIFQIAGNLTSSSAVSITLSGGAQAKNIFWVVAGNATLGTNSHFEGNILSKTGINLQTGASLNGRALAQTAVTLDANSVTKP